MSQFIKSWFVRPSDKSISAMFSLDNAPTTEEALRIQSIGEIIHARCVRSSDVVYIPIIGNRITIADGDWMAIGQ